MTNNRFDPPPVPEFLKTGWPVDGQRSDVAASVSSGATVGSSGSSRSSQSPSRVQSEDPISVPVADPYELEPDEDFDATEPSKASVPASTQLVRSPKRWINGKWLFWNLFRLCLLGASTGTALIGFFWLTQVPPTPDCGKLGPLALQEDKLYCAQQAAIKGDFNQLLKGLKLVQSWPKNDPRYPQTQQLLKQWSNQVLQTARYQASRNNFKQAISIARNVPANSPIYQETQLSIAQWQKDQDKGSGSYDKFIEALRSQNWVLAKEQIKILSRTSGSQWQKRTAELQAQLSAEQDAFEKLQSARYLADLDSPELYGEAIALAQTISRDRILRSEAQAEIVRWSRRVLEIAAAQLQDQDYAGAVTTAKFVPPKSNRGAEAKKIISIAQAQLLMNPEAAAKQPVREQLEAYWSAINAARQLPASHPLSAQLQSLFPQWEEQFRDLTRLQIANTLAQTGHGYSLQLAIQEAQEILPGRIQRLHAQNLVAEWQKDLLRLTDRPLLEQAEQLAQGKTAEDFQAAIAQAQKIAKGRPLRSEAQAQIAVWNRELKALADQPILQQAKSLAEEQKFAEAITVARQIGAERPLYGEAQSVIAQWTKQIQVQEQLAVLQEANSYAGARNYAMAIELAASIPPESSLYLEAQTAIAIWSTGQPYKASIGSRGSHAP